MNEDTIRDELEDSYLENFLYVSDSCKTEYCNNTICVHNKKLFSRFFCTTCNFSLAFFFVIFSSIVENEN